MVSPIRSTRWWSMPTVPNSLMSSAVPLMSGCVTRRFNKVVLPAPRKPVSRVTGMRGSRGSRSAMGGLRGAVPVARRWRHDGGGRAQQRPCQRCRHRPRRLGRTPEAFDFQPPARCKIERIPRPAATSPSGRDGKTSQGPVRAAGGTIDAKATLQVLAGLTRGRFRFRRSGHSVKAAATGANGGCYKLEHEKSAQEDADIRSAPGRRTGGLPGPPRGGNKMPFGRPGQKFSVPENDEKVMAFVGEISRRQ